MHVISCCSILTPKCQNLHGASLICLLIQTRHFPRPNRWEAFFLFVCLFVFLLWGSFAVLKTPFLLWAWTLLLLLLLLPLPSCFVGASVLNIVLRNGGRSRAAGRWCLAVGGTDLPHRISSLYLRLCQRGLERWGITENAALMCVSSLQIQT